MAAARMSGHTLVELPEAVLEELLSRLPGRSLGRVACSSRRLREAAVGAARERARRLGTALAPEVGWGRAVRYAEACDSLGRVTFAAGTSYTLFVDNNGQVYACGHDPDEGGDMSQLGLSDNPVKNMWRPTLVPGLPLRIVEVAAGVVHSLALAETGLVYSLGKNRYGQLGRGAEQGAGASSAPVGAPVGGLLERGLRARSVACGAYFSLAVCEEGRLWTWGANGHGELGRGASCGAASGEPLEARAPKDERVRRAAGGRTHTLALTRGGRVCACGRNVHGQLGLGTTQPPAGCDVLVALEALAGVLVTQVACGNNHSLAVGADGSLYAWGCGAGYQLGPVAARGFSFSPADAPLPRRVPLRWRVHHVAAGHAHSLVATEGGRVVVLGDSGLPSGLPSDATTDAALAGALDPAALEAAELDADVAPALHDAAATSAARAGRAAGHLTVLDPGFMLGLITPVDVERAGGYGALRVCAGARHSIVRAKPLVWDGVVSRRRTWSMVSFGMPRGGQMGVPVFDVPFLAESVDAPLHVQEPVGGKRAPFTIPITPNSDLEVHYYGKRRKSLAGKTPDEIVRILANLGPENAWRLPPSHPGYRPVA